MEDYLKYGQRVGRARWKWTATTAVTTATGPRAWSRSQSRGWIPGGWLPGGGKIIIIIKGVATGEIIIIMVRTSGDSRIKGIMDHHRVRMGVNSSQQ